jgi:hypothetical protein
MRSILLDFSYYSIVMSASEFVSILCHMLLGPPADVYLRGGSMSRKIEGVF